MSASNNKHIYVICLECIDSPPIMSFIYFSESLFTHNTSIYRATILGWVNKDIHVENWSEAESLKIIFPSHEIVSYNNHQYKNVFTTER